MLSVAGTPARLLRTGETHCLIVGAPNLVWLSVQIRELLARDVATSNALGRFEFRARDAFGELPATDDRQRDTAVHLRIADDCLWVTACRQRLQVVEETLTHHDNAAVTAAQMLTPTVGDRTLADPADEILVHDVAGDPTPRLLVENRRSPVRDTFLHERFAIPRHAREEPTNA